MKRKFSTTFFTSVFIIGMLFGGYACTTSTDDYVTEQELRTIIREELRNYLTQEQIIQLINNQSLSESRIRQIIAEELKGALTQDQINQIINAVGQGLSEAQIREIIKQETENIATGWKIVNISVKKEEWQWNDNAAQYETFADLPELTEFIYEEGAAIGYVFLGEQGVDEVQKLLPYINTYSGKNNAGETVYFTETISCDFQLGNPSTVGFFIKSSDLFKDPEAPQNYNFRVVLIW